VVLLTNGGCAGKIVICISGNIFPPSLSFLAEAQPRLEIDEYKRHFLAEGHIHFLATATTTDQKTSMEKLQIYFVSIFFYSICYQLANKTKNLLFAVQLLIYVIMV
jgi:hypothetical protein